MIAEAGHYALVLALGLALIQSTVPIMRVKSGGSSRFVAVPLAKG